MKTENIIKKRGQRGKGKNPVGVRAQVVLTEEIMGKIDEIAKKENLTRSVIIRMAIDSYLGT